MRETLAGVYGQTAVEFSPTLRGVFGLRADHIRASVDSLTLAANSGSAQRHAGVAQAERWCSARSRRPSSSSTPGSGFHSNDARGTTATIDPKTGDPVDKVPPLVRAKGYELGARTEAIAGLQSSLALWRLNFDSELVYVGDAGTTEASGASRRRGIEWNNRWVPVPLVAARRRLRVDARALRQRRPHSRTRSTAWPRWRPRCATSGPGRPACSCATSARGALIEDNSVRSYSSTLTNLRVGRKLGSSAELTLDVFNLFDRQVNDIQYFYESQLPGEAAPVTDRHVHPAEPRTARLSLLVRF